MDFGPDLRWEGYYLVGATHPDAVVTENFRYREFEPEGGQIRVHRRLLEGLQRYRTLVGPTQVVARPNNRASGCPPFERSAQVHARGDALDIVLPRGERALRRCADFACWGSLEALRSDPDGPFSDCDLVITQRQLHVELSAARRTLSSRTSGHPLSHVLNAIDAKDYVLFKRDGRQALGRQWGADSFVQALGEIASAYNQRTAARLGIGDLSHVRGDEMSDHGSHRLGIDADVYVLLFDEFNEPIHYTCGRSGADDGYYHTVTERAADAASREGWANETRPKNAAVFYVIKL